MFKVLLITVISTAALIISAAAAEVGTVSADSGLKLRTNSSYNAGVVLIAPKNSEVIVLSTSGEWCKVNYGGREGYMAAEYLLRTKDAEFSEAFSAKVTGSLVNLRAGTTTATGIVCQISKDTEVIISGVVGGWYAVTHGSYTGYIHPDYIQPIGFVTLAEDSVPLDAGTEVPSDPTALSSVRAELIEFSKQFVGTRYTYGGRSPSAGFDCSGFVYYVFKQYGYTLNPGASSQMDKVPAIPKSELLPGDLVFFNNGSGRRASHVGIYIGDNKFIHATSPGHTLAITAMSDNYYAKYYVGAGRVLPVE